MITGFIFEKVPLLFRRFCAYCRSSMAYRLLAGLWHGLCRLCRESFVGSLLCEHAHEGRITETSAFLRGADAVLRFIEKILRKVIDVLTFGRRSSLILDSGKWFLSLYRFFDFEFFTGLCLCAVLLCPAGVWHNIYGLGISAALLVLMLIYVAAEKKEALSLKTLGLPFVFFVLASVIGVCSSTDKGDAMRIFILFVTAFLFCIFVVADVTDETKLKRLLGAIWFCVCATACVAMVQRVLGVSVSASLTDLSTNEGMPGRVFATFENPNNYAEFLVLATPLAFVWCTLVKNDTLRRLAYLSMAFPLTALLMTYSRSGWVSFALAAFVFVFLWNKRMLPAIIIVCVAAVPFLPQTVLNRISTIGSTSDSSNMYRIYIWRGVLDMIKHNWLTGIGLGPVNFRSVYLLFCVPSARPAPHSHMLYLELWVEMGIAGVISYFALLFTSLRKGLLALKYASKPVKTALIGAISSLVGIMFSCAAEYVWYYPRVMFFYFIVLGVLIACVNIARKSNETEFLK